MSKQSPGDRIPNLAPWWITCHWWRWDSGALGIFVLEKGSGAFSLMVNMHIINIDDGVLSNLPALRPNSPTHVKNESIIRRRWAPDDCGPVTTEPGNDCNDGEDHPHHLQRQTNRYYRLPEAEGLQYYGSELSIPDTDPGPELWILGTGGVWPELPWICISLCNNHHHAQEQTQRGVESRNWFSAGVTLCRQKMRPHKLCEDNNMMDACEHLGRAGEDRGCCVCRMCHIL